MSLTLYAAPMSSATSVMTGLAELDVPHEVVMLDLQAGDQKRPDYLAINPNGTVPALVADGTPMFEALAIMQWLGDRHGVERGLWPAADAPERLTALSWTTWAYATYGVLISVLNYGQSPMVDDSLHHPPLAAEALGKLDRLLGILDAHLADRAWLLGDDYSLADTVVTSVVTYSTFCGVTADRHAHVADWLQRFQARPAFEKTWNQAPAPD